MKQIVTVADVAAAIAEATHCRPFTTLTQFNSDVAFVLNRVLDDRRRARRRKIGVGIEFTGILILLTGVMLAISVEQLLGWDIVATILGAIMGTVGQCYGEAK